MNSPLAKGLTGKEAETVGAREETELLTPASRVDSGLRLRQPYSEATS